MIKKYLFRTLTPDDQPIVWQMLYETAHLSAQGHTSITAAMENPDLSKYAKHWGKPDDLGFAACEPLTLKPVGAAWIRLLAGEERGYGYLNDSTPELAMGVLPEYRNRGIGTRLLALLIGSAKQKYSSLSLSVREDNPAVRLYKRYGFEIIQGSEMTNRVGGRSFNMQLRLPGRA